MIDMRYSAVSDDEPGMHENHRTILPESGLMVVAVAESRSRGATALRFIQGP